MKKLIIIASLWLALGASQHAQAQYGALLGLKMGIPAGLDMKVMLDGDVIAVEGIIGSDFNNNLATTLLFEYHGYLARTANWYGGLGSTVLWGEKTAMGLDAVIGGEITFENFPLNASLDWNPSYRIGPKKFNFLQFGLGIRYVLF